MQSGGGIYVVSSGTVITDERCQFKGNTASKGFHIFNSGSTVTLTCLPGQYYSIEKGGQVDTDFTGCSNLCPKGKYANGTASRDLSGCISCPVTKTCPDDGMGSPVPCPAGRFGADTELNNLKCSGACDPGYYCPEGSNTSKPRPCPAGRYVEIPGSSSLSNCTECGKGFYCEEGALYEKPCRATTYGDEPGLSTKECSGDCPAGFFCVTETIKPESCPPGFYSGAGDKSCEGCPVGFFAANGNSSSCEACSEGTFTPTDRAVRCLSCFAGQYLVAATNTSCTACLRGRFRNDTGLSCSNCPQGWDTRGVDGQSKCQKIDKSGLAKAPVLESIVFDGKSLQVTYDYDDGCENMVLSVTDTEYVRRRHSISGRVTFNLSHINAWQEVIPMRAKCIERESRESVPSPGWITAADCAESSEYLRVFSNEEDQAPPLPLYTSEGKLGPTCAKCPDGINCKKSTVGTLDSMRAKDGFWPLPAHLRKSFGDTAKCIGNCTDGQCASPYAGPLCGHCEAGATMGLGRICSACPNHGAFLVQAIFGSLFVFGAATYIIYDGIRGTVDIESTGKLPFLTLSLRTMTSYFQVASMLSLYKMKFPGFVSGMIVGQAALSSPGEVMANVDCLGVGSNAVGLFTAKQIIIFLSPIVTSVILCVVLLSHGYAKSKNLKTTRDQVIGSILIGLNLMYPTLVKRGALLFACRDIGKGQFLDEALDVQCYGPAHMTLVVSLGLPSILIFVVGFPASLLVVLRRLAQRNVLDPRSPAYNRRWVIRLGFLYAGYERRYAYWESLVLLRKAALSGFAVFLSNRGTTVQVVVAMLILYACHVVQIMLEPLEHDWHDWMESRSLGASLLILFACLLGDASSSQVEGELSIGASICVSLVVFAITSCFVWTSVRMTLAGIVLEDVTKNEEGERCFIRVSKRILVVCCRIRNDNAEWQQESVEFSSAFASSTATTASGSIEMSSWKENTFERGVTLTDTIPEGWERHYSEEYNMWYYVNRESGKSVWDLKDI